MATHDYNLANQSGASFRADLNNVLQAILTNNSSASAPSTTAAYMFWADTNTGILKIRNSSNDGWVELLQLDGTLTLEDGSASAVALGFRDELNTGIFSSGANNFDISIAGTTRLNISASGINITGTVTDDGATHDGDVTFTGASANVVFDKSDNALEFADNAKATFGTGADLSLFHDGSNSFVQNITGNLTLKNASANYFVGVNATGAVELYFNNTKKFETSTAGSTIHGNLLVDANSAEINIKAGTTSQTGAINFTFNTDDTNYSSVNLPYDTRATDGLIIDGGSYSVSIKHGAEYLIKAIGDGAIELYHDNSKKFETESSGCKVTGTLEITGHLVMSDNDIIKLGNSQDLNIYHTGSNSVIQDSGTGNLNILASAFVVKDAAGNENMIVASQNAGIEFYYDNTKRFEVAQYGAICTGTLQADALDMGDGDIIRLGDGDDFQIQHTGSNATLLNTTGYTNLRAETTLYLDGKDSILFRTGSSLAEKARFDSNGVLLLGTTSADTSTNKLNIVGSDTLTHIEKSSTSNASCFNVVHGRATGSTKGNLFVLRNSGGSSVGGIKITNSAVEFNTSSDYRLKENVVSISDGITRLKTLKPSRFNWIADSTNTPIDGFIAHEVSSVVPEAISGTKDAVITQALIDSGDAPDGKVGDPIYQEIDQSKIVPLLTAALQEAIAKIETLETKVAALEAA